MNRKVFALALALAAGTASAQNSIVSDQPGLFVDISGAPGVNTLINNVRQDDNTFAFTTTVTNAIFASTTVRVCTNGYAQWGGTAGSTAYTNAAIPATGAPAGLNTNQALLPQWDDMLFAVGTGAEIYWAEGPATSFGLPASRGNVLIIQWSNVAHYDLGNPVGAATYEIQVFQNVVNNVAAQMLYSDTSYDDARFDGGVSATIGFVAGATGGAASLSNVQWSFNADIGPVTDGTVLSLLVPAGPTNPSVTGAVNPASAAPGDTVLFTATPTGGINPNSTNMVVRGDLTAIGGVSNALFHDDGNNGDAVAGDHVYSFQYTIPGATPGGVYSVGLTVTDAQSRSGTGAISGQIFNPQNLGTLTDDSTVSDSASLAGAEVKWYRVTVGDCTTAAQRQLVVTTEHSGGGDSELGFYDASGTLLATVDDVVGLLAKLTFGYQGTNGEAPAGTYYIALGAFNTTFATPFSAVSTGPASDFLLEVTQVTDFPPDAGDTIATALVPSGTGELASIDGSFDFAADVDMYKIEICDAANFSATTTGGTTADTQMFLFDPNGIGVTSDDDNPAGGLQSALSAQFIPSSGTYYLAVSRYNIDPVDDGGNLLWISTPFNVERQPDGPGAGNPLSAWTGAATGTAAYTINFTGTCYPTNNSQCSVADVGIAGGLPGHDHLLDNNDFISFITLFFANDPQADMGVAGGLPGSDNLWDNNDFIAFIGHFFDDAAHCNG